MDVEERLKVSSAIQKYLQEPQIPEEVRNGHSIAYTYLWGTGNQFLKNYLQTQDMETLASAAECLEAAKFDYRQHGRPTFQSLYATILSDLGIALAETGEIGMGRENFIEALAVAVNEGDTNLIQNIRENLDLLEKRRR